jgi:RNA polymerase sigma factor (sigma-70 family)
MHAPPHTSSAADTAETLFLANLPRIRAGIAMVCRRYHVATSEQADFESSVIIKFIDNDYAVFRQFRGDSASGRGLRTFVYAVACRHLLDIRDREWGKWRPSRPARQLGSAAICLEQLIYRQRIPVREAVAMVSNNPRWSLTTTKVRGLFDHLPLRAPRFRAMPLDEAALRTAGTSIPGKRAAQQDDAAAVREALLAALQRLDARERRVLRLRFQQGLTIKQIAAEMGADVHALYRGLPRIFLRLRRELRAEGLDGRDVSALLGQLGDHLESLLSRTWSDPSAGAWAGPSRTIDGRELTVSR